MRRTVGELRVAVAAAVFRVIAPGDWRVVEKRRWDRTRELAVVGFVACLHERSRRDAAGEDDAGE